MRKAVDWRGRNKGGRAGVKDRRRVNLLFGDVLSFVCA